MFLKLKKILFVIIYFLFPAFLIYIYFSNNWYAITDSWSIAMMAGLIACSIIFNQFVLSARIKMLDRIFGLDKILKFHGNIMIFADFLLILHVVLKLLLLYEYNIQVYLGITAIAIFFIIVFMTVLLMVKTYTEPVSIFKKIRDSIIKKTGLQYQSLRFIHNFTFLALVIVTVHIILASSTQENNLRIYFLLAWFVLVSMIYLKNMLIKPRLLKKRAFTVTEVKNENDNITTVKMKPPENFNFNYTAGQFAYFKFLDKKPGKEEHPVSLSCPPGKNISITVKSLGDWTGKIKNVKPGDKVAVDGPYGIFSYTKIKPEKALCFIAGGIGITPFLCMLRDIKKRRITLKNIKLIWQVSSKKDFIYFDEIKGYEKEIDNFKFIPVVSRDENWEGISGRIDTGKLKTMDLNKNTEYLICAPNAMIKDTIKHLKKLGIKKQSIHFEKFNM